MPRRRFLRSLARFLVAAYVLIAAGPTVDMVVCVGSDGHQEIESRLAEDCCPNAVPAEAAFEDSCDCNDTPLLLEATVHKKEVGTAAPRSSSLLALVIQPTASLDRELRQSRDATDIAGLAHSAVRRSIVLLI